MLPAGVSQIVERVAVSIWTAAVREARAEHEAARTAARAEVEAARGEADELARVVDETTLRAQRAEQTSEALQREQERVRTEHDHALSELRNQLAQAHADTVELREQLHAANTQTSQAQAAASAGGIATGLREALNITAKTKPPTTPSTRPKP